MTLRIAFIPATYLYGLSWQDALRRAMIRPERELCHWERAHSGTILQQSPQCYCGAWKRLSPEIGEEVKGWMEGNGNILKKVRETKQSLSGAEQRGAPSQRGSCWERNVYSLIASNTKQSGKVTSWKGSVVHSVAHVVPTQEGTKPKRSHFCFFSTDGRSKHFALAHWSPV